MAAFFQKQTQGGGYHPWVVPSCSGYHYCTVSFNKAWTQALRMFACSANLLKACQSFAMVRIFDMVPVGYKAKPLSSVSYTTRTFHHHHHHHHHHHRVFQKLTTTNICKDIIFNYWFHDFINNRSQTNVTFKLKSRRQSDSSVKKNLRNMLNTFALTVCSCHVTYAFESESILYSCLNVKELLARSRRKIWRWSDCKYTFALPLSSLIILPSSTKSGIAFLKFNYV